MRKNAFMQKALGIALSLSLSAFSLPFALAQSTLYDQLNGQVSQGQAISNQWRQATPATKVITGTAAGATLGGATGLLTGLTMHKTSHGAMKMAKGTAVARGLAWGSVYGAGLGFLAGLGSAVFSPKPVAVSSVTAGNMVSR